MSDRPSAPRPITFPSIPEPGADLASQQRTLRAMKEALEILLGRRGDPNLAAKLRGEE